MYNPQFDAARRPLHLLTPEGWPRAMLGELLDRVDAVRGARSGAEDAPAQDSPASLRVLGVFGVQPHSGAAILQHAAGWCNWQLLPAPAETLLAHATPVQIAQWAHQADLLVMSHAASGAAHAVAASVRTEVAVVNMLDGLHAAPLAAIADVAMLRRRLPELHTRVVALCGDLVADARLRSVVHMLTTLGVPRVSVAHTGASLPQGAAQLGIHVFTSAESASAYEGADAVITYVADTSAAAAHPPAGAPGASLAPPAPHSTDHAVSSPVEMNAHMVLHGAPDIDVPSGADHVGAMPSTFEQACALVATVDLLVGGR